jgi:ABC-type lipoprotein export system ATPase subunit
VAAGNLIETEGVWLEYKQPELNVMALREVDVQITSGEFTAITGESGSGKSTLLALLGALDRPTRGSVRFDGERLEAASATRLTELRRERIGFVFQDFRLVQHLSAMDNALLPLLFSRRQDRELEVRAQLEKVKLGHRLKHRPRSLSRGEMQRVALIRALANSPDVLLADEPTANLDRANSEIIWSLLRELADSRGMTVIVATHNAERVRDAKHVIRLRDGVVESDVRT